MGDAAAKDASLRVYIAQLYNMKAAKWLIAINQIQNKSVYILCV